MSCCTLGPQRHKQPNRFHLHIRGIIAFARSEWQDTSPWQALSKMRFLQSSCFSIDTCGNQWLTSFYITLFGAPEHIIALKVESFVCEAHLITWSLFGTQQSLACNNFSPSFERACFEYKSGTINPSLSPLNLNTLRPAQHKRGMSSVAWWGLVGVVLHDVHHPALCLEVFPCSCTIYMMYTIMWLSTIIIPPPMASRLSCTWWIASPSEPTRSSRIKNTLER